MLHLIRDDVSAQRMLQLCKARRCPRENLLMVGTDQQQIRQDRHTKGVLDSSFLSTHLVCTQAQVGLEFSIDLLHGPLTLIGTNHLSRDLLVQIGHQTFRLFWAQVPPSLTQHHSTTVTSPMCGRYRRVLDTQQVGQP